MPNETWTIKKLLDWTSDYFKDNNIENPHLEAEILLAHALAMKRIDLYVKYEKVLGQGELAKFKDNILRRKEHEPTAYITGTKAFMSLDLFVNSSVLIPRPETELLVEATIDIARDMKGPQILDIGTGSGAVAVSLAKYIKDAKVHATDLSQGAVLVAIENAKKFDVLDRTFFEAADLFPAQSGQYDIIVSNPPYIRTAEIKALAPEIRDFEPASALDGGQDGMDYYRKILEKAKDYLKGKGYIVFEVGIHQSKPVADMMREKLGISSVSVKKDLNGIERVVSAQV